MFPDYAVPASQLRYLDPAESDYAVRLTRPWNQGQAEPLPQSDDAVRLTRPWHRGQAEPLVLRTAELNPGTHYCWLLPIPARWTVKRSHLDVEFTLRTP